MTTFSTPSRKGLIFGAVMVALYGLQQELALHARHFGYAHPKECGEYARLMELVAQLKATHAAKTDDIRIRDLMAHTQQTMRISHEEWDESCPITALTPQPFATAYSGMPNRG